MMTVDPVSVAMNEGNTVLILENASDNWKNTPWINPPVNSFDSSRASPRPWAAQSSPCEGTESAFWPLVPG